VRRCPRTVWVALLLVALVIGGCDLGGPQDEPAAGPSTAAPSTRPSGRASSSPSPSPTQSPSASRTPPAARPPALRALQRLPVKGRAPMTGYDRDLFGQAWSDDNDQLWGHNGCDTRNDVLRRDLDKTVIDPDTHGCVVLTGVLHDPYTGRTIAFERGVGTSIAVQIDHVVALADAWETGAQRWSAERRRDFANDPLELIAVDGPTNESKGAGDAATWLPPHKAFRCAYAARQIAVKATWGLWVKPAERDALTRILQRCPGQRLPTARQRPSSPTTPGS